MSVVAPNSATYATYSGYVTVDDYIAAPTGTDVSQLGPGLGVSDNRSVIAGQILSASNAADRYCQKVLAATRDTEVGRYRLNRYGHFKVPSKNTPIMEIQSVSIGTTPTGLVPVADLSGVWIGDKVIHIPYTGAVSAEGTALVSVTYVNGWAATVTTTASSAGASSLVLSSVLGVYPGQQHRLYDGGASELVTVSPSYVPGASPVALSAPLVYDHPAGRSFSNMPPVIREAVILLTSSLIKQRGSESIVLQSVNNEPDRKSGGESGMSSEEERAYRLLQRYQRVW